MSTLEPESESTCGAGRRPRLPAWLKRRIPAGGENLRMVRDMLDELGLSTVCEGAHCPNLTECFARRTATFMILGDRCTRACRFCAVGPAATPPPVREDEPEAVAEACRRLGLRHVVITSVTRDDLTDGGAGHFARTVQAVRQVCPGVIIEILTPDFQGSEAALRLALESRPDIFNHNLETVRRLYSAVRPQADYDRSLFVLRRARDLSRGWDLPIYTKSGIMVGLGETRAELSQALVDLREVDCDILTVGQYLAPSAGHYPVQRFVPPEEFEALGAEGRALGFRAVASAPFVRSSYQAETLFGEREQPEEGI